MNYTKTENNDLSRNPEQSLELKNWGYVICVEKKGKQYRYTLKKDERKQWQFMHKDSPGIQNPTGQVIRGILKKVSGNVKIQVDGVEASVSNEDISDEIIKTLDWLDELLVAYEDNKEEFQKELMNEEYDKKLEELSEKTDKFLEFLDENDSGLLDFVWYSTEWLLGGESKNVMKGFLCHISTYLKIKPIGFFPLGKAGEGKSAIYDSALELIPDEGIYNGRVTEKALYRKSGDLGSQYLDGKILTLGDLGGKQDIEKWSETIDRYKELMTDGKAEFEVVGEGLDDKTGERRIISFVLEGFPSLTLTSVNTESFDDQLMSRAIDCSPEATNEEVRKFFYFNKGNIAKKREYIINTQIAMLHDYIHYIKEFYSGIKVINPYWTCLESWFKKSEYYKRALSLYPSLVEAVTILNYPFRQSIEAGDDLYLVATKEDNKLIADLFNPSQGISEPAVRVFNLIFKKYKPFDPDELKDYQAGDLRIRQCNSIFSVGEIRYKLNNIKALKGLPYGDIMASLVSHGLIEAVDKEKRSNKNIYALSHHEELKSSEIVFDEDKILKYIHDVEWVYRVSAPRLEKLVNQENGVRASELSKFKLTLPPWKSSSHFQVTTSQVKSRNTSGESHQVTMSHIKSQDQSQSHDKSQKEVNNHDKLIEEATKNGSEFE